MGNAADSIELSLSTSSRMNLESAGYIVTISNPSVDLGEKNSIDAYVTVSSQHNQHLPQSARVKNDRFAYIGSCCHLEVFL